MSASVNFVSCPRSVSPEPQESVCVPQGIEFRRGASAVTRDRSTSGRHVQSEHCYPAERRARPPVLSHQGGAVKSRA